MGKKPLPCERIESNYDRGVTYKKRARGLIKKAIELSVMCEQHIGIVIADHKMNEIIVY